MSLVFTRASLLILCALLSAFVHAEGSTGATGGDQPIDNLQPSVGLNFFMQRTGNFPSRDPGFATEQTLGAVRMFAGTFVPADAEAHGQLLSIAQNAAMFSLVGTSFGGNGQTDFALPNLDGRVVVHAGSGAWQLGQTGGNSNEVLTVAQLPAHTHSEPSASGMTGVSGGSQPFSNLQPSLAMQYVIATQAAVATPTVGAGGAPFVGQISLFASTFAPAGWALADGQTLALAGNQDLFEVIGTTYGGDGQTTFQLPDLRGRTAVGVGSANGGTPWALGQAGGSDELTLTTAQMPAHDHALAPPNTLTGLTGGGQPVSNDQSGLGLNYIVATQGLFPPRDPGNLSGDVYLGEVSLFAGNYAPRGWAIADGHALSINQNQALFSLLGTSYGGNGITNFQLPDLRGRIAVGAGAQFALGEVIGDDILALGVAQLPSHVHASSTVPLPAAIWFFGSAFLAMSAHCRHLRRETAT